MPIILVHCFEFVSVEGGGPVSFEMGEKALAEVMVKVFGGKAEDSWEGGDVGGVGVRGLPSGRHI